MRRLRPSSEDEMGALFLARELASDRFGSRIRELRRREGIRRRVVAERDPRSAEENARRRHRLGVYRGYGADVDRCRSTFPTEGVRWEWVMLSRDELRDGRYIDWSYWLELSGGSRRPADEAERIRTNVRPNGVGNERFLIMAASVAAGVAFPPLILVTAEEADGLIVLEGHARLTAYLLAFGAVPTELEVLVGSSPEIARWPAYGPPPLGADPRCR
jgi:hypothetical protein